MNRKPITLDLRADLRCGREPFSKIMKAAAQLQPGEQLLLVAPFEPVPLIGVLENRGFSHSAQQIAEDHWEVLFTLSPKPCSAERTTAMACQPGESESSYRSGSSHEIIEVDARGLEPPEPMFRILESLVKLSPGAELRALTDRRPMHLYAQLGERRFTAQTEQQSDGSFLTHVRHR